MHRLLAKERVKQGSKHNLKTKVLISAASAYFTQSFDPHLHTEILSYRPRRQYHGQMTTTNGNHAIKAIKEYIGRQRNKNIYVAECDIQKFFDIINHDVDQVIVAYPDPDRLFVRYGDDIILMHTDREKCEELLEKYKKALLEHKLIFHKFENFSDLKDREKNTKKFWKGKSKPVFLWGRGEGNASEWIGFVGYEIHREGHTRLRLSTLDKKFKDVNRKLEKLDTKLSKKYNQEVQIKEVFESNEGVSFFKKIGND